MLCPILLNVTLAHAHVSGALEGEAWSGGSRRLTHPPHRL